MTSFDEKPNTKAGARVITESFARPNAECYAMINVLDGTLTNAKLEAVGCAKPSSHIIAGRNVEDLSFYPTQSELFLKHYHEMRDSRWTPSELNYSMLNEDWESLSPNMQVLAKRQLAFLSQFDNIVCTQCDNFKSQTSSYAKEIGYFYTEQASNELIHSEVYSLLIVKIIPDLEEQKKVLNSIANDEHIYNMAIWVHHWMDDESFPLPELDDTQNLLAKIVAFCCLEGIIFSFSFCVISYLRRVYPDKLSAVVKSNEWIKIDEFKHQTVGCDICKFVLKDYIASNNISHETVSQIKKTHADVIKQAVGLVKSFIDSTFGTRKQIDGLTKVGLHKYTEHIADELARMLELEVIYNTPNPFNWMKDLSIPQKSNIHEVGGPTEYSLCSSVRQRKESDYELVDNLDF